MYLSLENFGANYLRLVDVPSWLKRIIEKCGTGWWRSNCCVEFIKSQSHQLSSGLPRHRYSFVNEFKMSNGFFNFFLSICYCRYWRISAASTRMMDLRTWILMKMCDRLLSGWRFFGNWMVLNWMDSNCKDRFLDRFIHIYEFSSPLSKVDTLHRYTSSPLEMKNVVLDRWPVLTDAPDKSYTI